YFNQDPVFNIPEGNAGRSGASGAGTDPRRPGPSCVALRNIENRVLIEVNRNILLIVTVGDGALQIHKLATQDGPAGEELARVPNGHTPDQPIVCDEGGSRSFGD